ncbi:hypothetical protein BGO18_03910 [Candidatus Saccharibacteria bacterium 47-87]|nr:MAG: hypothetical protein BGO18_03910 [Candidatus Saccharibacteria bacterium 47-87]
MMSSNLTTLTKLSITQLNCKYGRILEMSDTKTNIKPTLYTVGEAAEELRVSKWMIYRLLRNNELKSLTIASRRLIASDDLVDFIKRHKGDYYG